MNTTNVESERYSDYFNLMPDISNHFFQKKLKPDNMICYEYSVEVSFSMFSVVI